MASSRLSSRLRSLLLREPLLVALAALFPVVAVLAGPRLPSLLPRVLDVGSLCTIIGLMMVSRGLELSGLLSLMASRILAAMRGRGRGAVMVLALLCAASAMVVMNDASLFVYVPLARALSRMLGICEEETVVFMAIAANVGSSLTPIGNPQNIIIWRYSGVSFAQFMYVMAWFVAPSLASLLVYMALRLRRMRGAVHRPPPPIRLDVKLAAVSLALLFLVVVMGEEGLQPLALVIVVASYLFVAGDVVKGFDYALVAVFLFMFLDFGLAARLMASAGLTVPAHGLGLYVASILVSQLVSNVPATILLVGLGVDWRVLALGVNVAGVGFILGSLANIIAVRLSSATSRDYHRVALPYFAAVATLYGVLLYLAGYPPRLPWQG